MSVVTKYVAGYNITSIPILNKKSKPIYFRVAFLISAGLCLAYIFKAISPDKDENIIPKLATFTETSNSAQLPVNLESNIAVGTLLIS